MSRIPWPSFLGFLLLISLMLGSGCLNQAPSLEAINLTIREKEVIPDSLGECTYRAVMVLTNTATGPIPSLTLYIEIYDPEIQKGVAITTIPVKDLKPGETRELTASLKAHCRSHYTIRAFVQY
jgi:hypothetical protein